MSTQLGNFNALEVKPATMGGSIIPVSDNLGHLVVIYDDETLPSNNNPNNGVLNLKVKIIEGAENGMEGVYRINYFFNGEDENSKTTKRIAGEQLSAICHAVNVYNPKTVAELYNKPFRIIVVADPNPANAEKGYTKIKGVLCADGGVPGFPDRPKVQRQAASQSAPTPSFPTAPAPQAAPAQPQAAPAGWGATPITPAPEATQAAPAWGTQQPQQAPASAPPWAAKP